MKTSFKIGLSNGRKYWINTVTGGWTLIRTPEQRLNYWLDKLAALNEHKEQTDWSRIQEVLGKIAQAQNAVADEKVKLMKPAAEEYDQQAEWDEQDRDPSIAG